IPSPGWRSASSPTCGTARSTSRRTPATRADWPPSTGWPVRSPSAASSRTCSSAPWTCFTRCDADGSNQEAVRMSIDPADDTLPRGVRLLYPPRLNKLMAFSEEERETLGLIGLVPEGFDDEERQLQRVHLQLGQKTTDLERYVFLSSLQDNDETLFYSA